MPVLPLHRSSSIIHILLHSRIVTSLYCLHSAVLLIATGIHDLSESNNFSIKYLMHFLTHIHILLHTYHNDNFLTPTASYTPALKTYNSPRDLCYLAIHSEYILAVSVSGSVITYKPSTVTLELISCL